MVGIYSFVGRLFTAMHASCNRIGPNIPRTIWLARWVSCPSLLKSHPTIQRHPTYCRYLRKWQQGQTTASRKDRWSIPPNKSDTDNLIVSNSDFLLLCPPVMRWPRSSFQKPKRLWKDIKEAQEYYGNDSEFWRNHEKKVAKEWRNVRKIYLNP